jgi:ribose transport system substrate-binding protein
VSCRELLDCQHLIRSKSQKSEVNMSKHFYISRFLIISILIVIVISACAGPATAPPAATPQPSTGTGQPPMGDARLIKSPTDLNIASFHGGSNNTYLQANIKGVEDTVAKIGAKVHIFDANFDVTQMQNQAESALTQGYNAWVFGALDPNQSCNVVKQAIAKDIIVSVQNQGLCGNQTYTPGTLTFVGGQTRDVYNDFLDYSFSHVNSGKVAVLTGPALNYNTNNMLGALAEYQPQYPNIEVVANQQLDYTTDTAYKAAQDIIQANPDLVAFLSNYSGMTQGVVQAVKQAGKESQIKIYDMGGNEWAVQAVKDGDLEMTIPFLPYEETMLAVQALADYADGKQVKTYYNLTDELTFPGAPFVTKDNADQFTPEY